MYKRFLLLGLTGCIVFSSILWGLAARSVAAEAVRPNILFLSSYTITFNTLPAQLRGITEALPADDYQLDVEFMDSKRFARPADEARFYALLKDKMLRLPRYDAVILGDDAALLFALKHQQELFASIPMVFLGINSLELARQAVQNPWITGVAERADYKRNIDLIQVLFPATKNIVAVIDQTLTAQGDQQQFQECIQVYPGLHFSQIDASACTQDELAASIAAVGDDSVLLYMDLFEDREQHSYTIDTGADFIAAHARVPVFRCSSGGVGRGILGGIMISFEDSGRMAGSMVREILEGKEPAAIPMVQDSPVYGCFDQRMLDLYRIPGWKLPAGSKILHRDPSFFEANRTICLTAGALFFFLLLLIGILWLSGWRRKRIMYEDYLTKLHNRMWMMEHIQAVIDRKEPCAILIFDLDFFKRINDSYGHAVGDQLLVQTAQRLRQALGRNGILARFGGDEFIGLADTADVAVLRPLCEKILQQFKKPFYLDGHKIRVSLSLGVACFPQDSNTVERLMVYADTALYAAKTSGKCRYRFFDAKLCGRLEREGQVHHLLEDALEQDGFQVVYQPIFLAESGKFSAFEALLRLKGDAAFPGEFIPVAEKSRMILDIGRVVTAKVIRQMAEWQRQGYAPVVVAVNFSNNQLLDKGYPGYVKHLLAHYRIRAEYLVLEVTESIHLNSSARAKDFMQQLSGLGVRLAIDDFGRGYSSINYLDHIPFAQMKLDKGLLDRYEQTGDTRMILGIIQLAHSMGLTVTAEGVETEVQRQLLIRVGCDFIQGYLWGKPMEPKAAEAFLQTGDDG